MRRNFLLQDCVPCVPSRRICRMNEIARMPTGGGVLSAARKVAEILPPTPLLPVKVGEVSCWAKAEVLQPIGAFKIRGGWHRLTDLDADERARGVVAVSSGNHAQGVAWAAQRLGIAATIVMPRNAPAVKIAATRALGAEVVLYERPGEDRDEVAARLIAQSGATPVHAFADPWVIEGQGSAGIEIAAQLGREPSRIVTPCGGGGPCARLPAKRGCAGRARRLGHGGASHGQRRNRPCCTRCSRNHLRRSPAACDQADQSGRAQRPR